MRNLILSFLMLAILFFCASPVAAQAAQARLSVQYRFGEEITFQAKLPSGEDYKDPIFFFQLTEISKTLSGDADTAPDGSLIFSQPLQEIPLRAFSTVEYWLQVTGLDGQIIESPHETFYYEDNRFDWQTRSAENFRVHWYDGDTQFAQTILDVADLGLKNIQKLLPLEQTSPIDIYVYASAMEMRSTLQISGQSWVGAHADPDLGVMVVSLPAGPEQRLEIERQVPHELMHILLYHRMGLGYANLPVWLNEGLASVAELYPNPDYLIPLERASQKGTILPMTSLCREFPRDMSGALLAYAQSASFTRFLHTQYGTSGLELLVQQYADGVDCERGIQGALGSSLTQLERNWRSEILGENAVTGAALKLLPWLAMLLVAVALPLIFSFTRPVKKAA